MSLDQIAMRVSAESDDADSRTAIIRKTPGKDEWAVKSHKGKSLGKYDSKAKAEKRLQQVEMFKHMKGKKRKSFVVIASRIAGADIYERLVELDNAIEKAEEEDNEEALERLRYERASVMDAIEYEEETT